ncbi:MAG: hypothetical protein GF344_04220 [Chitinivibrionales bacterium]|nr:hypothetical protein [Chitinivibrionales bacterium]MBD3356250.1 hypothetical protein [Chitinivibrionales bacterium]
MRHIISLGFAEFGAVLLVAGAGVSVYAQPPTSVGGGGSSYVSAVAGFADVLLAGTWGGGLMMSRDSAASWKPVENGPTRFIYDIHLRESLLWVGTDGEGVHCYDLDAAKWREDRRGLAKRYIFCLGGDETVLLAGTWRRGLFRSANDGADWSRSQTGLGRKVVYCIGTHDRVYYAGTARWGVFASKDTGKTWENIGLRGMSVTGVAVHDGAVVAGTWKHGTYRRAVEDTLWVSVGVPAEPVRDLFSTAGKLYAAKRTMGVFVSDDGMSWRPFGPIDQDPYVLGWWRRGLVVGTWGKGVYIVWGKHKKRRTLPPDRSPRSVHVADTAESSIVGRSVRSASDDSVFASDIASAGRILSARSCHRGKLVICYEVEGSGSIAVAVRAKEGRLIAGELIPADGVGRYVLPLDAHSGEQDLYLVSMRTRRDDKTVYALSTGVSHSGRRHEEVYHPLEIKGSGAKGALQ